jgi:hypothetical protein
MLQADLFCRVVENRFTKPHELGRRSHVRIIWWAKPLPAVDIEMGNLAMEGLTPAQCRDLARNILDAAAKAEAYPGSPTEIRPADSTARGDQGLQVSEQALAEMGPVGASIEAAEQNAAEHEAYRQAAKQMYEEEGKIEIDRNAVVSQGADPGAYVQAWVWVSDDDLGLRCQGCAAEVDRNYDRYAATPCGTFCDDCMVEHAKECEVCRHEFDIPETGAEGE